MTQRSPRIHVRAALHDGTPVCIRPVRPNDKERLRIAFERLSPQTVYRRFFHPRKALTSQDLWTLTELDFHDHVALVVIVEEENGERLIAVGRFVRVAPGADCAEIGVTVADEYQRRGAGTLVLQQLVAIARSTGVRELVALVLDENREMLEVIRNLHLPTQRTIDGGLHRIVLSIARSPAEIDSKLRIAAC